MVLYFNETAFVEALLVALDDRYCSFYKQKYQTVDMAASPAVQLASLPFLTREELVATPLFERVYVAPTDVRFIAYTSGTTSGTPLLCPFGTVTDYQFSPSLGTGAVRPLIVYPPLNKVFGASFIQQCAQASQPVTPVFGDVAQLANSAVLAAQTACDSLYATPTLARQLAPYIQEHYTVAAIKLVAVASELLTDPVYEQLRVLYPAATIVNLYASSEIGQFIMHSQPGESPHILHLIPETVAAAEIIAGELVVTYTKNPAFPLLRYRTGDYFRVVDEVAGAVTLDGRAGVDVIKVGGYEIRSGDIDTFFSHVPQAVTAYQVHSRPGRQPETSFLQVECVGTSGSLSSDALRLLRETFLQQFRLADGVSVATAVERGIVDDVEFVSVPAVSAGGAKRKVLVQHQ